MRKRMICMALTLSMVLPLVPRFTLAEEVWKCGMEEHTHEEVCSQMQTVCNQEADAAHIHEDNCYASQNTLLCTIPQTHAHGDDCYTVQQQVNCTLPDTHVHEDACYGEDGVLACELPESHTHGEGCFTTESTLTCELPESHTHDGGCSQEQQVLTCEVHVHDDSCVGEVLVCKLEEHTHTDACKCICETLCTEGIIMENCGICSGENADLSKCWGKMLCTHGQDAELCILCDLEELIDTLPAYESMGQLEGDAQTTAVTATNQAQQEYYALTEEQQAQVRNRDKLLAILEAVENQPVPAEDILPQAAAPMGLEWGVRCRREYPNIVQEYFPGAIKWEAGNPDLKEYQVAVYQTGNSQPVYQSSYNGYGTPFSDTDFVRFYLPALGSGSYYFTITTLGDDVTYRDSDPVQSGIWEYSEPVDALPVPTNQTVTTGNGFVIYTSDMPRSEYVDGYRLESQFSVTGDFEKAVSVQTKTMSQEQDPNDPRNYVITSYFPVEDVGGYYRFRAMAISNNLSVIKDSGWSEYTAPFCYPPVSSENKCGDNLTWKLENGVLTISGTGAMYDYDFGGSPWHSLPGLEGQINSIVIEPGVSYIGKCAFWSCGASSVTIADSVTTIGDNAFYGCGNLTSITIPSNVTSIGYQAFVSCSGLTNITIPDSVSTIGDAAFFNCKNLTGITLPSGLTAIGMGVFLECSNLTAITIPAGVTAIGEDAFARCSSLSGIVLPDGITTIESGTFAECSSLASIVIPNGVSSIGDGAFDGCSSLNSITIPDSVGSIGRNAFAACSSLASITIPAGVTSVGDLVFVLCDNLKEITFQGNAPAFESSAFYNIHATVYYPANNTSWTVTPDPRQQYGGTITWVEGAGSVCTHPTTKEELKGITYECLNDTQHKGTKVYQMVCANTDCNEVIPASYRMEELEPENHEVENGVCTLCKYGPLYVTVTAKKSEVCAGQNIGADVAISGGSGEYPTIYWTVKKEADVVFGPEPTSVPTFSWTANEAGSYSITVRVVDSLGDERTLTSGAIKVEDHVMEEQVVSTQVVSGSGTENGHNVVETTYKVCTACGFKTEPAAGAPKLVNHNNGTLSYEKDHPHKQFKTCQDCGYATYTGNNYMENGVFQDESQCCVCRGHSWGESQYDGSSWYRICGKCKRILKVNTPDIGIQPDNKEESTKIVFDAYVKDKSDIDVATIKREIREWDDFHSLFDGACTDVLSNSESFIHQSAAAVYKATDIIGSITKLVTDGIFGIDTEDRLTELMVSLIKENYMNSLASRTIAESKFVTDAMGNFKEVEGITGVDIPHTDGTIVKLVDSIETSGTLSESADGITLIYNGLNIACKTIEDAQATYVMQRYYEDTIAYLDNLRAAASEGSYIRNACDIIQKQLDDNWPLGQSAYRWTKNVEDATEPFLNWGVTTVAGVLHIVGAAEAAEVSNAMMQAGLYLGDGTAATSTSVVTRQIQINQAGSNGIFIEAGNVLLSWSLGNFLGKLVTFETDNTIKDEEQLLLLYILNAETKTALNNVPLTKDQMAADVASLYLTIQEAGLSTSTDYFIHYAKSLKQSSIWGAGGALVGGALAEAGGVLPGGSQAGGALAGALLERMYSFLEEYPSEEEFKTWYKSQYDKIASLRSELGIDEGYRVEPKELSEVLEELEKMMDMYNEKYLATGAGDALDAESLKELQEAMNGG